MFDTATILILVLGGASLRWLSPVQRGERRVAWTLFALGVAVVLVVRASLGPYEGMILAAAVYLCAVALGLVHILVIRETWPRHAMAIALCTVAATGAFMRALRFEQQAPNALFPDVKYYRAQATRTANPWAAGTKTPLWSALQAPLVRAFPEDPWIMRVLSCLAGIAVVPALGFVIGRALGGPVGVAVAALCALDTWMIDLCTHGLREHFNLLLWCALFAVAFGREGPRPRAWWKAGAVGGVLLMLRNTNFIPLVVLIGYAGLTRKWRAWQAAAGLALAFVIVAPFYVNQWRAYGDPFALEKRDTRYYVNREFGNRSNPPFPMAPREARRRDPFAGQPVSPFAYLVSCRPLSEVVRNQWVGVRRVVSGRAFQRRPLTWLPLACGAGVIGLLLLPQRWLSLFFFASIVGMQAHLIAIGVLEQRMILQAYPIWLAGGFFLIWIIAKRGFAALSNRHAAQESGTGAP
jgi:hypothetical protein